MRTNNWKETFPGGQLIAAGVADYRAGRCSVPACLVSIARTRLTRAGLLPEGVLNPFPEPERQLYQLLREAGGDAYSRYNALLRELVSFEQSLDQMK
ncbi:MAG: hypothetical protein H0U23_12075 [Blastocatellia bacterium]|nr:hypothetical protein [Blastocatellia bacterium]